MLTITVIKIIRVIVLTCIYITLNLYHICHMYLKIIERHDSTLVKFVKLRQCYSVKLNANLEVKCHGSLSQILNI